MKLLSRLLLLTGLWVAALHGSAAEAEHQLSWHFAGTKEVQRSNPEAVLVAVSDTRLGGAVRNQIQARIADWFPARLGWNDHGWMGGITFVRPLLKELFENESLGRLEGDDISTASWVMALHLDPEGLDKWSNALLTFGRKIKFGEPQKLAVAGLTGWNIPGDRLDRNIAFVRGDEWLIVANSFDASSTGRDWAEGLAKSGRPGGEALTDSWLKFSVDPAIVDGDWVLPVVGPVERVSASFSWMQESVRMSADVALKNEFDPGHEKWMTPKGLIHDPLVSFTAVRGAEEWISSFAAFGALPEELRPDQLFAWSRGDVLFVSDFALPVTDSDRAFALLSKSVPENYNERIMDYSLGRWTSATNMSRLLWRGLPVFVPYLGPTNTGGQGYLAGGIFPLVNEKEPAPAPQALFDQIENRDDLMYYDWEISVARIRAFEQATRFVSLVFSPKEQMDNAHAHEWLSQVSEKLGNAITEATVKGRRELNIDRKSAVGLTGIELWMLAHWVDGKDFPAFPYSMPKIRAKVPAAGQPSLPVAQPVKR